MRQQALAYHEFPRPGKVSVEPSKPCATQGDLSLAYTPGVAEPVREIARDPANAYRYTNKGNLVAVITDGTAILKGKRGQARNKSFLHVNGQILLSGLQYQPFGPPRAWTWSNGSAYGRGFDGNGWPQSYPLGGLGRSLNYDAAGRIAGYSHAGQPAYDQAFGYDALDRLTGVATYQGSQGYAYDANGNRTLHQSGSTDYPYSLAANSNRLLSVAGPVAKNYLYDAAGHVTALGALSLVYDAAGRLTQVRQGPAVLGQYTYNGLGERVKKQAMGAYVYDAAGHLLGEYTPSGQALRETVWLGDTPVAVLKGGAVYYVYADHLDAPRLITDTQDRPVWRWDNADAFGVGLPNENPGGLGIFTYNLRLPGQYYDQETGLHYNYFRDYDPRIGRYISADPIGLAGGLNLYQYAKSNPLKYTDPTGQYVCYYSIDFNQMVCYSDQNPSTPSYNSENWGSGSGDCYNNAACYTQRSKGPLPPGCYRVGGSPKAPRNTNLNRRDLIPLQPIPSSRDGGFQLHNCGNNSQGPSNKCSEGCAVTGRNPLRDFYEMLDQEPGSVICVNP